MVFVAKTKSVPSAEDIVLRIADELGIDRHPLLRLIWAAREARRRLVSVELGSGYVRAAFISSEAKVRGVEKPVLQKTLDGDVIEQRLGVPQEKALHYAVVGAYAMKCTCTFALMAATSADRAVEEAAKRRGVGLPEAHPFSKRVLCKHTLSLLDKLLELGVGDRDALDRTLRVAVAGFAIFKGVANERVMNYVINTLVQLHSTRL